MKAPQRRQPLAALNSASSLAIILKTLAIATSLVLFYYQDLSMVFRDALQNEATDIVLIVPFLFAYFLYRKRKMLRASMSQLGPTQPRRTRYLATVCGTLLCAAAITLYWYGSYTFTPLEYHVLTLPLFAAGMVLVLFGPQTFRQLAFPVAFLVFLMPLPLDLLYTLGSALSVIASGASNTLANAFGIPSRISSEYANPTIIITRPDKSTMGFTMDLACSGVYPLIGFLLFAFLVAYITRDKPWKKATVFLIGLPLIYLLNIGRITVILMIGYYYGEQLALQVFHLLGGLVLTMLGTAIILLIAEKLFKTHIFTRTQPLQPCPNCGPPETEKGNYCEHCGRLLHYPSIRLSKGDIVKVAAIAVTVMLLMSIQAPVFALTSARAQITTQTPTGEQGNTEILPQMQDYTLSFVYRDTNFEEIAHEDASLLYSYTSQNETEKTVFVAVEIASSTASLHRWEFCLITWPQTHGSQPRVTTFDLRDTRILENPPITARYFAFKYTNYYETQVVLYWYETSTFSINGTTQQKHVKISVITYPNTPQDVPAEEEKLLAFATAIVGYWQPVETWTQIALIISENGLALTAATLTLLAGVVVFYAAERARIKKAKTIMFNKLSRTDQQLIEAVQQTERKSQSTLQNVTAAYQSTTHTEPGEQTTLEKLIQAEETGLVSRRIANHQDEPVQTWRTNLNKSVHVQA